MKKLIISTDCTCDLPEELIEKNEIEQLFFYVYVGDNIFRDRDEITAMNVFESMQDGLKVTSAAPPVEDYVGYFKKLLRKANDVIHLAISSSCSLSYSHAMEAVEQMGEQGKHIHVIDSKHLSTGIGLLVIRAAEAAKEGREIPAIISEIEQLRERVSTSFISKDGEYLFINGKINSFQEKFLKKFKLHPVLALKNGELVLTGFMHGNYEKAQMKYVSRELVDVDNIDRNTLFITHAGATAKELDNIRATVDTICKFNSIYVTNASATVSSNCGPETAGVLYIRKTNK